MSNLDDWTRDWGEFFARTVRITEQWAEQTLQTTVEAANAFTDELEKQVGPTLDQWADELQHTITPLESALDEEVERASEELAEFITPLMTPLTEAVTAWVETLATPLNNTIEPLVNEHATCVGCRHYHGQAHGGNMLVCGMYPYGPDTETCPDWESVWREPSTRE